jgi:hypothetical protein
MFNSQMHPNANRCQSINELISRYNNVSTNLTKPSETKTSVIHHKNFKYQFKIKSSMAFENQQQKVLNDIVNNLEQNITNKVIQD